MDRPAALVLCPEFPYPLHGGGPMRTASILNWLSRRYAIDLVVFDHKEATVLPRGLVHNLYNIPLPFHSRSTQARVWRNAVRFWRGIPPLIDRFSGFDAEIEKAIGGKEYDLAIVEHFWCAPYAPLLRQHTKQLWLNLHNVESILLARSARAERWPKSLALRRFAERCLDLEREWIPEYDALLVASQEDAKYTEDACATIVYPNSIPRVALPEVPKEDVIVFSGNLAYEPNTGAVRWFRNHIWPAIRERHPHIRWRIVGKNDYAVREIVAGDDRIELTGEVEHAITAMGSARVSVVPLLAGSGTRIKIIEAWAAGIPVVSTTIGSEGLPAGDHIILADAAGAFARQVSRVLDHPELASAMATEGRRIYEEQFTWEAAWASLQRQLAVHNV